MCVRARREGTHLSFLFCAPGKWSDLRMVPLPRTEPRRVERMEAESPGPGPEGGADIAAVGAMPLPEEGDSRWGWGVVSARSLSRTRKRGCGCVCVVSPAPPKRFSRSHAASASRVDSLSGTQPRDLDFGSESVLSLFLRSRHF